MAGAGLLSALAVREVISRHYRYSVLVVVALVAVAVLMPFQDESGLHWSSAVTIVLAMGGRLVFVGDPRKDRLFLTLVFGVWLSSVAWSVSPVIAGSSVSFAHPTTWGIILWLGVFIVGKTTFALGAIERRYQALFDGAPIGLLSGDFRAVGRWLEGVPVASVDELRDYLDSHPDELAKAIRLVRVGDVNPAALAMVGAESRNAFLHLILNTTEFAVGAFVELLVAIWEQKTIVDVYFTGTKVTGEELRVRLRSSFSEMEGGGLQLAGGLSAITDVTALWNATASKDELLASVSHQLRTPLTAIVGFTNELLEGPQLVSEAERTQMLSIVAEEAESMKHLIEDLLIASRPDTSNLILRMSPISLAPYLGIWSANRTVAAPAEGLRFGDCDITICADPLRLGQIIRNLIANASSHGGDDITIEASTVGGMPVITVSDNGPGIQAELESTAFEPYQTTVHDSSQLSSLGIGLSVSRKLARAMGGDLTYVRRGGCTEFRLALPAPDGTPPGGETPLAACPGCNLAGTCTWGLGIQAPDITPSSITKTAA